MDLLTVAVLLILLSLFVIWKRQRPAFGPLPPGPRGLPLVGSLFSMDRHEFKTFTAWSREYGEIVCFRTGTQRLVILNSYRAMKTAFVTQGDVFSGRPNAQYLRLLTHNSGIVLNEGPVWQEHRRFLLRVLRDFGFGRSLSEDIINIEWQQLQARLDKEVGQPVGIRHRFQATVNNVIARLTFGERTGVEDPDYPELTRRLEIFFLGFTFTSLLPVIFPFIMRIPPLLNFVEKLTPLRSAMEFSHDYVRRKIDEHRIALGEGGVEEMDLSQAKDVCDALLIERAKLDRQGVEHSFTEWQVIRDMLELFLAGTDTTATTLSWATFYMATNPEVQQRVHEEIDSVVGQNRNASMKDRLELPYVCAVVDEVLRRSSIARSGVPHRVLENTTLLGYAIPKDTFILFNVYGIHHDPDIWERPKEFYPEHFLGPDGRYQSSEYLNPFSIGKRACLGETLARMEIFLFFVGFMQNYRVELADKEADVEAIELGTTGNIRRPGPHEVVFSKRN